MKKLFVCLVTVMLMLLGVSSCKPSLPDNVLSKGQMVDILYDYHVALSMARTADGGDQGQSLAYREAVLKKHDVSSADFDSSMVYYMRHTELLEDVYKDLGDRLSQEITALGGNGENGQFANLSATGDTANIWNQHTAMVFSTMKPFNYDSFEIQADSSFHKGDRLMIDFDAQFIYQDGMRDGIVMLAVQFKNDSIAQSIIHVQNSQHYSTEIADNDSLGIKSVKGYFLLSNGDFGSGMSSQTTLKLMFLEHIKLIRMHAQKPVAAPASESSAPTSPSSSPDSMRKDSAKESSKPLPKPMTSMKPLPGQPMNSPKPMRMNPNMELKPINSR